MKAVTPNKILFFVGAPGVGKTTLVRAYMESLDFPSRHQLVQKPKWTYSSGAFCAAGHYTGATFDGADTVGYNQVYQTLDYWAAHFMRTMPVTIFDGDRFSNAKVWAHIKSLLYGPRPVASGLRVVRLEAEDDTLAKRRQQRGSNQNASWMQGRATKAANFSQLDPEHIVLDASQNVSTLLATLVTALDG